jgi:hypothetical protein
VAGVVEMVVEVMVYTYSRCGGVGGRGGGRDGCKDGGGGGGGGSKL